MNTLLIVIGIVLSMVGILIIDYANHVMNGVRVIITTMTGFALFVIGAFILYIGM